MALGEGDCRAVGTPRPSIEVPRARGGNQAGIGPSTELDSCRPSVPLPRRDGGRSLACWAAPPAGTAPPGPRLVFTRPAPPAPAGPAGPQPDPRPRPIPARFPSRRWGLRPSEPPAWVEPSVAARTPTRWAPEPAGRAGQPRRSRLRVQTPRLDRCGPGASAECDPRGSEVTPSRRC